MIIEKIKENHVDISLILGLLEKFSIFLMMKMIEKNVDFEIFLRVLRGWYLLLPVQFSSKSGKFYYGCEMIMF